MAKHVFLVHAPYVDDPGINELVYVVTAQDSDQARGRLYLALRKTLGDKADDARILYVGSDVVEL